jgi:uncharacterized membrane protein YraQ (UPF0718 family)
MILVKLLAFENTNTTSQMAIHPYKKRGTLTDYIQMYSDIGPSYLHGVAIATATKVMAPPQLWKAIQQSCP